MAAGTPRPYLYGGQAMEPQMSLLEKLKLNYERLPGEEPFRNIAARVRKRLKERLKRRELKDARNQTGRVKSP